MTDLNEKSLEDFMVALRQPQPFISHFELCRLVPSEPTWRNIAYPPPRWKHLDSFVNGDEVFDIWVNWDGRAEIRHRQIMDRGPVILRFWAPAAQIFEAIAERCKCG